MIRLVPMHIYEQTAEQGPFLTAVRNWLHTLKIFLFLILTVVFIFSAGAGWGIIHFKDSVKPALHKQISVKSALHKRHS